MTAAAAASQSVSRTSSKISWIPIFIFSPSLGLSRPPSIHFEFCNERSSAAPLVMHADCREKEERRRRKDGRTDGRGRLRREPRSRCGRLFTSPSSASAQREQKSSLSNVPRLRAAAAASAFRTGERRSGAHPARGAMGGGHHQACVLERGSETRTTVPGTG